VRSCWAGGGVAEAVAHFGQLEDGFVELVGFGRKHFSIDSRMAVGGEHERDFVEREACELAETDERESFEHGRSEQAPEASTADRCDEASLFVEAERRRRDARLSRDLANVENTP
jgi:hypothetical protein